jgi:hypothetical protein
MNEPIPDKEWYISKSTSLGLLPRCPFASSHKCPRYYQSLSLLGDAGCTKIDAKEDKALLAKWKKHSLWPQTMEQRTGVVSVNDQPNGYHQFCPEVAYDTFSYFATYLSRHSDEYDTEFAHKRLAKEGASRNDPGWYWRSITAQHYSECPLYSPLAHDATLSPAPTSVPNSNTNVSRRRRPAPNLRARATIQHEALAAKPVSPVHSQQAQIVFIAYAHSDSKWVSRFQRHLKPILRNKTIDVWSDKRIRTSDNWHEQIQSSLARSCGAVLFISSDFLASDYIADHELPIILKGASDKGLRIFSIILSPCAFKEAEFKFMDSKKGAQKTTLSVFQAANPPSKTLAEMRKPEWERTLLKVANDITSLDNSSNLTDPYLPQASPTPPEKPSGAFGPGDLPPPTEFAPDDPHNPDFFPP